MLYRGDGTRRAAGDVLATVAGRGAIGTSGDGGPATEATLDDVEGVAVGPDGSVYFVDFSRKIRKVSPNGIITAIAGTGVAGISGDGGPATQAQVDVGPLAFGPDGSLYIGQRNWGVIRRIWPDGTITRVAGDPSVAFCVPDEQPSQASSPPSPAMARSGRRAAQ